MMLQFAEYEYNLLVRVRVCQVQNGQTRRKKPQAFQAGLTFKLNLIFNSVIIYWNLQLPVHHRMVNGMYWEK